MNDKKLIDSAEVITMDEIKHLKLPYFYENHIRDMGHMVKTL